VVLLILLPVKRVLKISGNVWYDNNSDMADVESVDGGDWECNAAGASSCNEKSEQQKHLESSMNK
jgi:hypothetical protein